MITLFFLLFLVGGIVLYVLNAKDSDGDKYEYPAWWVRGTFGTISYCVAVAMFITMACFIPPICTEAKYDEQIRIITEYNEKVEDQIYKAVKVYLEHEQSTLTGFYPEVTDSQTAIGVYFAIPELKGDAVISELINTYQSNINEVKSLELEKTNLATKRFLVYFGH